MLDRKGLAAEDHGRQHAGQQQEQHRQGGTEGIPVLRVNPFQAKPHALPLVVIHVLPLLPVDPAAACVSVLRTRAILPRECD
ncbi:hypothetical protein D3C76_1677620 [compost metagenome]